MRLAPRVALYNLVLALTLLVGVPWLLLSLLFNPRRRVGIGARFGGAPDSGGERPLWIHAVSVGEVRAIAPMLSLLAGASGISRPLVLSTVTVTGQETARRECREAARIFYFPLDLPLAVGRALDRVRPSLFVTAETEIWPNFLAACFSRGVPVAVVNGRLSDRSFARYRRFAWLFRPFFARIDLFLMQSEEDARRALELGARRERVRVTGNTKYDGTLRQVEVPDAVRLWASSGPLLAAVSTHRGEESLLLDLLALPALEREGLLLALAPRHPERFDEVAALLTLRGVPFARWTEAGAGVAQAKVLLVDAMGVLDGLFPLASLAFVGGSLVPTGGHNLLEPAMHGVPVLTGPHTQNFRDIALALIEAGGCREAVDAAGLAREVAELLANAPRRAAMGRAAKQASESARGASRRNAEAMLALLGENRQTSVRGDQTS
jgi:3-deoxy-D-manno-octulosonic-acid transferase